MNTTIRKILNNNVITFPQIIVLYHRAEKLIFWSFRLKTKKLNCAQDLNERKREIHANIVKRTDDTMQAVQY